MLDIDRLSFSREEPLYSEFMRFQRRLLGIVGVLGFGLTPALGQPVQSGAQRVELGVLLRQMNSVGTFMMATAHPDDESNGLLARLAKGEGHRTVLVTATRGDGGQNEIGAELFDALAVLRTEELLAAHRLDGAEQYFTRAVDFGYSFSRDETFERWGRTEILADFVRMIRTIRPDVVAGLSPDGRGGGQHHQASAVIAHEAYHAAGDPTRFPEQIAEGLRVWQPEKFYFSAGFEYLFRGTPPPEDTMGVDLGGYDSLLGQTYAEIGRNARGMHKCQGMSSFMSFPGPPEARYRLAETTIAGQIDREETDLFDGVDTTVESLDRFAGTSAPQVLTVRLGQLATHARDARESFAAGRTGDVQSSLISGLQVVRELRESLPTIGLTDGARWETDFRLAAKERQLERAVVLAYRLRLEALANDGLVAAGQQVAVTATVTNHGSADVVVRGLEIRGFEASSAEACAGETVPGGGSYRCDHEATVPSTSALTNIHWTHVPGFARYEFEPDVPFGAAFRPTPFAATFTLEVSGLAIELSRPIRYRYSNDLFTGEKRTTLNVVPALAVTTTPDIAVIPRSSSGDADGQLIRVTVTNAWPGAIAGDVGLDLPDGWAATPDSVSVTFSREDEQQTARFVVTPSVVETGEYVIGAHVDAAGVRYGRGYQTVEYPHIGRRHLVHSAESTIKVIDVALAQRLTVGYVHGVGDAVPPAIEQLGASLETIDSDTLAWGDLSRFDVIVTGVRAYERRVDLRANNDRLLRYVEDGGTLIVQYNKFEFNDAQYGPYAASVSRNRVTSERAPVRILASDHQVFGWPNQIGPSTWDDWVQERGLYFLGEKDPAYTDLVELEDTFEWNPGVKRGALVEARYGAGRWIYVGLGLWRQLPAGTTGAYQLLANLLSLGAED